MTFELHGVDVTLTVHSLALEDVERAAIIKVMELHKNNRSRAAHMLRIDRRTLYRKMEKLGIVLPAWVPEYESAAALAMRMAKSTVTLPTHQHAADEVEGTCQSEV